jgi:DNA-binding CsgD family transcriptional regulator
MRDHYPKRRIDWLSNRERHVLVHMMEGLSAEEISKIDYVCLSTVRSQIRSIFMKLGVTTQLQAVAMAHREMWPDEEERRAAFHQALARQEEAS